MPTTFKPVLKPYKDKNGLQQLVIRVTMDRKARYADSGYSIYVKQFNPNNPDNPVRSTHPKAVEINTHLAKMIRQAKAWIEQYPEATHDDIVQVAEGGKPVIAQLATKQAFDFFPFADAHIAMLEKQYAFSTYRNVLNAINHAKALTNSQLTFEQINLRWAKDFQAYLLNHIKGVNEMTKTNSARTYINKFAHIFKLAMEEELIPLGVNPFTFLKWKKIKIRRVPLDESEILALEQIPLKEGSAEFLACHVFLFQFYLAGMRISDVLLLRWNMINNDRVDYMMKKTRQEMSFPLVEKAAKILKYYSQFQTPDGFVFPFLENKYDYSQKEFRDRQIAIHSTLINRYIKIVAKKAGITKHVSSHIARHTFGHIASQSGLSSYDLRDCFRHSSTRMTDVYTSQFDQKRLDKSLKKVVGDL